VADLGGRGSMGSTKTSNKISKKIIIVNLEYENASYKEPKWNPLQKVIDRQLVI